MTYQRPWPYPPAESTVIHHTTDVHLGYSLRYDPTWDMRQLLKLADRMHHPLSGRVDGWVDTGDITDFGGNKPDTGVKADGIAKDFIGRMPGAPAVIAPGNHDLRLREETLGGSMEHSSAAWEHVYKRPANGIKQVGDVNVLWFTPDVHEYNLEWKLSTETLQWADEQARKSSRPVILANHYPLWQLLEQTGGTSSEYGYLEPKMQVDELIGNNRNITGMLCGHKHYSPSNKRVFTVLTVGGRRINHVCGPSLAFSVTSRSGRAKKYDAPMPSLYVSILDDRRWEVRLRTHAPGRWLDGFDGYTHRVATMDSRDEDNPVTFSGGRLANG